MKKLRLLKVVVAATFLLSFFRVEAQENKSVFTAGADFYSNYIFRGTKLGTGPSVQPNVKFIAGGLTIGVWGAFDASGYSEADPYISYSFPFGLSLGITDYYSPALPLFETSDTSGSHALELNAGFATGGLTLSANYIVNRAGGIASVGNDLYFQAGYAFEKFSIVLGAGDGWHTLDGEFDICHIGIGTTKEIKITDTFTVPVTGQVIVNPDREALYVVVGFSL
ncbi:MAG TPA: hypothetical protein VHI78_01590 [Bacteroidales bacterium]|jgi:hypothetical protein|nr:hypothetical protein [Bacteroidales bacterium]